MADNIYPTCYEVCKSAPVLARRAIIGAYEENRNISEVARLFRTSRKTVRKVLRRWKERGKEGLKDLSRRPKRFLMGRGRAYKPARLSIEEHESKYPEAIRYLEVTLQSYNFLEIDKHRISSTSVLERLNPEIRYRNRVVGVFSSLSSYLRLIAFYLKNYTEDRVNA